MSITDKKIADRIIEQLEKGTIPWKQGWKGGSNLAFNRISKKPYIFLNQIMLPEGGEYATFNQWKKLGGKVKKGEHGYPIVGMGSKEVKEENSKGEEVTKIKRFRKYSTVFHISQIEGVEPLASEEIPNFKHEDIASADDVIMVYVEREHINYVEEISSGAWYCETTDKLNMPKRTQFEDIAEFYSTAFHEMVHSTGHTSRLNRDLTGKMGDHKYGIEELIAELGSAMLMNELEIETEDTFQNSAAYIQSWIKAIKENPEIVLKANTKAKKAMEFILKGGDK